VRQRCSCWCVPAPWPTPDDIPRALAAAFGAQLQERARDWADIQRKLAGRGRRGDQQSEAGAVARRARCCHPRYGGMIWSPRPASPCSFGVPAEMRAMWNGPLWTG